MRFKKITDPTEYQGGDRTITVPYPFWVVEQVLDKPYGNDPPGRNPYYPDDDYKTDVCWCFKGDNGYVTVWNYKSGPAYNDGHGRIANIPSFSAYVQDQELFNFFLTQMQAVSELLK